MGKLTILEINKKLKAGKPGRFTDGDGLHLHLRPSGRNTWVYRFMKRGKTRDLTLGPYPAVSLARARDEAGTARDQVRDGVDPVELREVAAREAAEPDRTFRVAATRFIDSHKAGWKNEKHIDQWTSTLETYAYPVFGDRDVRAVDTAAVLQVLQPIWITKTETAARLRGRIEAVLDSAKAMHWREGENPARWKGHLASILPKPGKVRTVEHHPSLPWQSLAAFLPLLRVRPGSSSKAIEFAILTAARSGEIRGLTRRELDLDAKVWTVPATRMKAKRVHRVPLSTAALAFLAGMDVADLAPGDLVFPGQKSTQPLSDMSLTAMLRRMNTVEPGQIMPWVDGVTGEGITVHGFRSTFRVWAGEKTTYPREIIEQALAHAVGDAVEAAYARTDLLERRRALMEEWGRFVSQG